MLNKYYLNKGKITMTREIFIKYNPYKLETEVRVDGNKVKSNSALNVGEQRLQEWIEDLPKILVDECNVKKFNLTFHGTILDYEDLLSVANAAKHDGISINVKHIPAKEIADKEKAIDEIFAEIQDGPFEELKQKDVVKSFEIAKSSEFPVSVVATMSAGKSTLINALLNQKLMPAKQEACTATITEIKDNDNQVFRATVYDKNGELIETHSKLSYEIMEQLNGNADVSKIVAEGDIPFVNSDDISLVLVDTPGPNNSRDPEHKAATYRMLNESSKTLVLYIMNATQLAVNDDYALLSHVADSMKVGGKQSKDRFIFVVNKLDDFKQGEDSVESAIEKVRKYLEDKGIENPNIFPASALTALDIRTTFKDIEFNDSQFSSLLFSDRNLLSSYVKIMNINEFEELHLEKYAPLTPSGRGEINRLLLEAEKNNDAKQIALIHTGIISIESAIRTYLNKYAKTAKIKNIVDTFTKKLESAGSFEQTKREIMANREKKDEITAQINVINKKLQNGEDAKRFKKVIDNLNFDNEIRDTANRIVMEAQNEITKQLSKSGNKLSKYEAEHLCNGFAIFAENLQAQIQVKLEDVVTEQVVKTSNILLNDYKKKIKELTSEISVGDIKINPFELLNGDISSLKNYSNMISDLTKEETVVVREGYYRKNSSKKWYKPWTWFQSSEVWVDAVTEKRTYVDGAELAKKFFAPIQKQLFVNSDNAIKYAKSQVTFIKKEFKVKFDQLDEVLRIKLDELSKCTKDADDVEALIKESQQRLIWLEKIQTKINNILEI